MVPTLRRAHSYASSAALVFPAFAIGFAYANNLFELGLPLVVVGVDVFLGLAVGYCLAIGGGFTSNVRQPLAPSMLACALAGAGAALSATWLWPNFLERFATDSIWFGVFLLGAAPGIGLYALLMRVFGTRAVAPDVWKALPP